MTEEQKELRDRERLVWALQSLLASYRVGCFKTPEGALKTIERLEKKHGQDWLKGKR